MSFSSTRRIALLATVTALSGLVGCGRSSLRAGSRGSSSTTSGEGAGGAGGGDGGGGATSTTTTSGGGGVGGTGGAPGGSGPCPELMMVEEPRMIAGSGAHQLQPRLTYSSDDLAGVTVALEWKVVEGPPPIPSELRHASFKPWTTWPSGQLGPVYLASLDGGVSFAVANSGGNRFAAAFSDDGKPGPPNGIKLVPDLLPNAGDFPPEYQLAVSGRRVLFLARSGVRQLVGYTLKSAGPNPVESLLGQVAVVLDGGVALELPVGYGCAGSVPLAAGAVGQGDGWLVAISSGTPFAPGSCPVPSDPPNNLFLARAGANGAATVGDAIQESGPIHQVAVAPHADGAWVTWIVGGQSPRVRVARMDAGAKLAMGPVDLPDQGAPFQEKLAATNLGEWLLVAWAAEQGNPSPTTILQVVDAGGTTLTSGGLLSSTGMLPGDLLAAPAGDRALFAWTEQVGEATRTFVGMLACQP